MTGKDGEGQSRETQALHCGEDRVLEKSSSSTLVTGKRAVQGDPHSAHARRPVRVGPRWAGEAARCPAPRRRALLPPRSSCCSLQRSASTLAPALCAPLVTRPAPKGLHTQCVQGTPTNTGVHALPEGSGLTFAAEVNSGPRGASPSRESSPVATPSGPSPPEPCPSLLRTRRACLSPPGMALTRLWAVGRGTGPSGL